jgi:hypothetical protein
MTTIEVSTSDRNNTIASDHVTLIAVCVFALLGLAGIFSMTV